MAGFTDALEVLLLDHVFGDPTWAPPANWFVGLSTTTPTEAGGNFTEPVGGGYGRVSTAAADWAGAVAGQPSTKANGNLVTFPNVTGAWGLLTFFGLFDAASGGNLRMFGALLVSKSPTNGDVVSFAVGVLIIQLGDPGDVY